MKLSKKLLMKGKTMSRKRKQFRNKSKEKFTQKENLMMLVEGETEEHYINYLKLIFNIKIKIEIIKKSTLASNIIDEIIKVATRYNIEEDELILVYDLENSEQERRKFTRNGRLIHEKTYLTQPYIEFHFLLHFQEPRNKYYRTNECDLELKKYLPQYRKGKDFAWDKYVNRDQIIKSMDRSISNFQSYNQQSFSTIGLLIKEHFYKGKFY